MNNILRTHLLSIWTYLGALLLVGELIWAEEDKEYKRAEKYFFEKKFRNAKDILLKIITQKTDHTKAISLLGDIYLFQKNYREAISQYRKAIELSREPSIEYFRLGQAYLELDQDQISKGSFQKAYTQNPGLKRALFQIGYIALFFERDKKQTIQYWKQFIREAPDDPQYEKVKRAIALLEDPNFKIPPKGSDISLQEALLLGTDDLKAKSVNTKDKKAGNEKSKTSNKTKELLEDEEL